jgi:pyrroloquinoline quinone biosynthesis protein B
MNGTKLVAIIACVWCSVASAAEPVENAGIYAASRSLENRPFLMVLGTAQDAGYPQAACQKLCCREAWNNVELRQGATCLAIVSADRKMRWLVDCTPNFPEQLRMLDQQAPVEGRGPGLHGIFLTHAHIGHYSGLIHLGREVMGARSLPVYTMPRMESFLKTNGPWSQLVKLENIELRALKAETETELTKTLRVTPLLVPHRDEFSETVGFIIQGPNRRVLYLPDIDKWSRWDRKIEDVLAQVDLAYLDGTFYANGEIPGRDMSEIPHPFIEESMKRLASLPDKERAKVRFIHLNHTNPALRPTSDASRTIRDRGFGVARTGDVVSL